MEMAFMREAEQSISVRFPLFLDIYIPSKAHFHSQSKQLLAVSRNPICAPCSTVALSSCRIVSFSLFTNVRYLPCPWMRMGGLAARRAKLTALEPACMELSWISIVVMLTTVYVEEVRESSDTSNCTNYMRHMLCLFIFSHSFIIPPFVCIFFMPILLYRRSKVE